MRMKRANLVLDGEVLESARAIAGLKTYSEVVNLALREFIKRATYAKIDQYASSDVWEGDLAEMRSDSDSVAERAAAKKTGKRVSR
jgi:Arc/MetJ family transcription regulator